LSFQHKVDHNSSEQIVYYIIVEHKPFTVGFAVFL